MFTGIIRQVSVVERLAAAPAGARLAIDVGPLAAELAAGGSLAVNGACRTVAAVGGAAAEFDVVAETLARTTLGALRRGSRVNLETPLRLGGALDGHLVLGHVDGVAEVRCVRRGGQHLVEFAAARELTDLMVSKGAVALDGVALTQTALADGRFAVALIPATLERTTLARLAAGSKVNVETDVIGKYVRRCLGAGGSAPAAGGLSLEKLKENGFA